MPRSTAKVEGSVKRRRVVVRPSPDQQLAHEIGNALAAMELRLNLVLTDQTCMAAQAQNLTTIAKIIAETSATLRELQAKLRDPA